MLTLRTATDDAEQLLDGAVKTGYSPIRIGNSRPFTAFRFAGAPIPRGATIVSAKLRMQVVAKGNAAVTLRYSAEKSANSGILAQITHLLTARPKTTATVLHSPGAWTDGTMVESPELGSVVQEVVAQSTWAPGNAITMFIADAGSPALRQLVSFEGGASKAVTLVVRWRQ